MAGKYFRVTLRSQGKGNIRVIKSLFWESSGNFPSQFLFVRSKRDSRWRHKSQEFLQLRHLLRSPAGKSNEFARVSFYFYSIRRCFLSQGRETASRASFRCYETDKFSRGEELLIETICIRSCCTIVFFAPTVKSAFDSQQKFV